MPLFLRHFLGKILKNCTSCMIEHRQILRLLFLRGLKTSLFVGGLGVEDQRNGLREVPILHVARRNLRKIYTGLLGKYDETGQRGNPNDRCKILRSF
jgi:hypothetical protein